MEQDLFSLARTRAQPRRIGWEWALTLLPLLLLIAVSLLPLLAASRHLERLNDDTYITLTYAKSLAAGNGWRYNGGVEALGTTTPLFALLVAGLARLLPALPMDHLAVALSSACWLGTAWLFALGYRGFGLRRVEGWLLALSVLTLGGWAYAALGMESLMLLFGLVGAAWLAATGRAARSGLLAALLYLVRPEGVAMLPVAGAWLLWQARGKRRAVLGRFLLGAALPLLGWGSYALATFGTVLPTSASAKLGQGIGWPGELFWTRFLHEWLPPFAKAYGVTPWLSLLWPLLALGLFHAARRAHGTLLLAAWVGLFAAGYSLLHAPGYWWYMLPLLFALKLFATLGGASLLTHRRRTIQLTGVLVLALFFAISFQRALLAARSERGDARADTYLAVAAWLDANATPGSTVAFVEIGYLGFFSDFPIVDLAGLTNPAFTGNASRLDLAANFWQAEPDFLLHHPAYDWALGEIVNDPRFADRYRPVAEFPSHVGSPMILYERVPLTPHSRVPPPAPASGASPVPGAPLPAGSHVAGGAGSG